MAGVVTAVTGRVIVARPAAARRPLRSRDAVLWRDVLETGEGSLARVALVGGTTVTVRELSRLEFRREAVAGGVSYAVELLSGAVRASVARLLIRPGERVEVRTRNAVASVRGTDFIVEAADRPALPGLFGLLGLRRVVEALGEGGRRRRETIVVTLSGAVAVSHRLAGRGPVELAAPLEAVRVGENWKPVQVRITPEALQAYARAFSREQGDGLNRELPSASGNP